MEQKQKTVFNVAIIGVLFIVLCGNAYYIRSKQTAPEMSPDISVTPTTVVNDNKWKLFTNATYKFNIAYPPSLSISTNGDYAVDLLDSTVKQEDIINPQDIKLRISVNQNNHNFDRVYNAIDNSAIHEEAHAQDAIFTKVRNRMIEGFNAVDYTYDVPGHGTEKFFTKGTIINRDGTIIEISSWNSELIDMEQIIQTIHFFK